MKRGQEPSTEQTPVDHAARCCQAASLSLTASRLRGLAKTCSVESEKTGGFFAAQRRMQRCPFVRTELGDSAPMLLLRHLKDGGLITGVLDPQRKDDPDPDSGERTHRDGMTFPLSALA
jgi:hypothetical protein